MNPIKPLILAIAICLLYIGSSAQTSTALKYTYDAAGNRVKREIIIINKSMAVTDTTDVNRQDSSLQAAMQPMANADAGTSVNTETNENKTTQSYTYQQGEQKVIVFPNPTAGQLQIKITPFTLNQNGEITLYDMQGKQLIKTSCTSETTTIDLSRYPAGSYILKIRNGELRKEWEVVKE